MLFKKVLKLEGLVIIGVLKLMQKPGNVRWIKYQIMMSKKEYPKDSLISSKICIAKWVKWITSNNPIRCHHKQACYMHSNQWGCRIGWFLWVCQSLKKKWRRKGNKKQDFLAKLLISFPKIQRKVIKKYLKNLTTWMITNFPKIQRKAIKKYLKNLTTWMISKKELRKCKFKKAHW